MKKFAYYIRVSTQKQGASMLGLESQQKICRDFIKQKGGECVAEFKDVESGTHRDRKGLSDAINFCKQNDCALVFAKLDRLARDVEFCFKVVNTGIEIHFVDMPNLNTLLLGVFASVAQYERELTSERTKRALAAKKARGEATGAASGKWRESYNAKSDGQKKAESMEKGRLKNERYLQKRDTQVFLKVLRNVFPNACKDENAANWDWKAINTKGLNKYKIISLMRDYKEMDEGGTLFKKWDLEDESTKMQIKLSSHIQSVRNAVTYKMREKELFDKYCK